MDEDQRRPAWQGQNGKSPDGNATRLALADQRAVDAYRLRIEKSYSFRQIAEELSMSPQGALAAFERGRLMLVPKEDVDSARDAALERLTLWEQMVLEIAHGRHALVSFGRLVEDAEDPMPRLAAIDRLLKIAHERRMIIGYTAPTRRVVEVISESQIDAAIKELNEQAAQLERDSARETLRSVMEPENT